METVRNIVLDGRHGRPVLVDLFYKDDLVNKDVVVFCHGYKGYKDWGAWDQVAEKFAGHGFFFVKMNFSFNGGTPEQPIDFPDLEAFGNNNYIKELDDLETVLDWLHGETAPGEQMNLGSLRLIGHSRGGGIVLIKANEDQRVSGVVSWAGVSDFASRFPTGESFEEWKKTGVGFVHNARTKQDMPHYFQFYTSFKENEERLTIKKAVSGLNVPYLIIHGSEDETVKLEEAKLLHSWGSGSDLHVIEGGDHTFGAAQPWEKNQLPEHLDQAVDLSIQFFS